MERSRSGYCRVTGYQPSLCRAALAQGGHDRVSWAVHLPAGSGIDQQRVHRRARLQVDYAYITIIRREVTIAEGQQGQQYRAEIPASLGQHIFIPGRTFVIPPALE